MRVLLVGPGQDLDRFLDLIRRDAQSWETQRVADAEQAIESLGQANADVVVADRRMGGPHAESLLVKVREAFPGTACVLFDGVAPDAHAGSVALNAVPRANDADSLQALIARSHSLHRLLIGDELRKGVGALDRLPSVPRTYWSLIKAASDPDSSVDDVARIVESDPAMSLKVLQLANAAFFGLPERVTSISRAVSYIGMELLKGLVLTAHVFMAADRSITGFSLDRFQLDSIRSARLAQRFLGDPRLGEEAFTAGLVHDVGKVVLAMKHPEGYAAVVQRVATSLEPAEVVEKDLIGIGHPEAGAFLLSTWGIPFTIVECVAYHHRPAAIAAGSCEVLAAVHAADALLGIAAGRERENRLDVAFLERAGFGEALPRWREQVEAELSEGPAGLT